MKNVSAEEERRYYEFVIGKLKSLHTPSDEQTLWHYTTGSSTIAIILSGKLWSTQVGCVNDHMELKYATSHLRKALANYKNTHHLKPSEDQLYQVAQQRLTDETSQSGWFISSFSEVRDDLSQWRAYGDGEGGYSLGFDKLELYNRLPDQTFLAKVNYDRVAHEKVANDVAETSFQFFTEGLAASGRSLESWIDQYLEAWGEIITFIGPVIKHPSFASEKEWRLIRDCRHATPNGLEFIQKKTLMARHLPLTFKPVEAKTALPLTQCYVGPSRNNAVSVASLTTLLATKGYTQVAVELSDVPYQTA